MVIGTTTTQNYYTFPISPCPQLTREVSPETTLDNLINNHNDPILTVSSDQRMAEIASTMTEQRMGEIASVLTEQRMDEIRTGKKFFFRWKIF